MTTRADLIETAARALAQQITHAVRGDHVMAVHGSNIDCATAVLDAVLPQITTAEQLEALPSPVVVVDAFERAWQKHRGLTAWWPTVGLVQTSEELIARGPLTVVWQPQPAQETP
jgi:hypothetical protein